MSDSSYSSNIMWKWLERILSQIIQLAVQIVLARIVSVEEFGIVSIVVIFTTFASVFVQNGFCLALVQKKDSDELDFSSVFIFNLVLSFAIYAILFVLSPLIANFYEISNLTIVLRVYLIILPINAFGAIQNTIIQKKMLFRKTFFCSAVTAIVSGVIGIVMAFGGFGVWALVAQQLGYQLVYSFILVFVLKWKPKFRFSGKRLLPLIPFGLSMLFSSLIAQLNERAYSIVIGKAYDSSTLALFNKGHQFPNLATSSLNTSNSNVLFAVVSKSNEDKEIIRNVVRESIQKSLFFALPMLVGMYFVAREMVLVLLTSKWEQCIPYLKTECVYLLLILVSTIFNQAIKAYGKGKLCVILELSKLVLTFVAFFFFYKKGLIYACYAKIGVAIIMLVVSFAFSNAYFRFTLADWFKSSWKMIASVLPIVFITFLASFMFGSSHLIAMICFEVFISAILYVLLTYILKVEEVRNIVSRIKNVLKRRKTTE